MSVKLTTNLSQRLVLTPQLRQRIEMLQMTTVELGDLIQQQLTENPVLEEVANQDETRELASEVLDHTAGADLPESFDRVQSETSPEIEANGYAADSPVALNGDGANVPSNSPDEMMNGAGGEASGVGDNHDGGEASSYEAGGDEGEVEERPRDSFEEIDFGREFQEYLDPGYRTQEYEYNPDAPTFEQFLTRPPSLAEHLSWQLHLSVQNDELCDAAETVIGNLDEDGRINTTNDEIARQGGWSEELVEEARQVIMQLDPVGCATHDARECLLIQLEVLGCADRLAASLVREHLADLQQHKLPNLSKQIGASVETLIAELELIRTLDPYPGRRYDSSGAIHIAPEVFVEKLDDDYVIYFADDGSARLRISQSYQEMLKRNETTKEARDFIKDKMRSAVDLLRNIEHRRQTIYRVVEAIVHRQREFLDHGVQSIKPMMLKDIAEDIGMHLSTISRVVNRKYAHTPQGVIELRRFFTEGMTNEDGEEVSTRIIKLKIKKLIEDENSHSPITDDQVVKILAKEGIRLSRRTVAKYRDQMRIPGSRERRAVV